MKHVRKFPHKVRVIENTWIPMSDGCRLAARIFLPKDAEERPVPAILEYIPYRKRDHTRRRDSMMDPYIAGHGYAFARVDMRGSGDSDGVLEDEYLAQEQQDGVEVLRWLAAQPWCDGNCGIIGISWGGFNGLQIAALNPPELKAIITVASTDDRYADDVHYMGGCLLGDNLSWASVMLAFNSCPPDPEIVGERWRDLWLQRLNGSGLWLEKWMRHQRRDDYWKHGSVCEDFSAIKVPVFALSGWADGYTNSVFRLMANLGVPRKALIGPWSHKYPHMGRPGPAIGFLQESLRWWDHWLKGKPTGVMDEPMIRMWMQDSMPPHTQYETRPGRWVAEEGWPSPRIQSKALTLVPDGLVEGTVEESEGISVQSPLAVGLFAGKWCSYAAPPDLPHDQRQEDGGALIFQTDPLEEAVEICGAPVVELELAANQPSAMVAVRLSDVSPNGDATRITYGLLNLTHRDSHENPEPLVVGQRYRVSVQLNDVAQQFPMGHRIRLAISTSYFPLAWPPPEPVMLSVFTGGSRLILPVRPEREADTELQEFPPPECARPMEVTVLAPTRHRWRVVKDLAEDISWLEVIKDDGTVRHDETGMELTEKDSEWYRYRRGDFDSVHGEVRSVRKFRRGDWEVRTETRTLLSSNKTDFFIHATLDAYEAGERVFSRNWHRVIPRDHV